MNYVFFFQMSQMESLYNVGDVIFANVLRLYEVETVVAIGRFCSLRAQKIISRDSQLKNVKVNFNCLNTKRKVVLAV